MMSMKQIRAIFVLAFAFFGAILIGFGTNWQIGTGLFLCMLAFEGTIKEYK
jgi:hypothetical protein